MCVPDTCREVRGTTAGVSVPPLCVGPGNQRQDFGLDGSAFSFEPSHRSYVMFLGLLSFVKWGGHAAYFTVLFMIM